ncbi:FGGY family carbohydrate kinase [Thalassotalea aquiviva]|uniref:FGGY family carbohydrate kinase n=1 Tax=Thalassotalea aquiviva TaxID=3242415 RepID=UPI00352A9D68
MHSKTRYYLAIDFGSQSIRTAIINHLGQFVFCYKHPIAKTALSNMGESEQPAQWYQQQLDNVFQALAHALSEDKIASEDIVSISVTTIRNTLCFYDQNLDIIRPIISWQDQRDNEQVPRFNLFWRSLFNLINLFYPINSTLKKMQQAAITNWLWAKEPKCYEKVSKVSLISGYLHHYLSGHLVESDASVIGYLPFNFGKRRWHAKMNWQYQALAFKPNWRIPIVPVGTKIGNLKPEFFHQLFNRQKPMNKAQQHLGNKGHRNSASIALIASASDKACEILGTGCVLPGQVHISLATAITVSQLSKRCVGSKAFYPGYPSAQPELFICEAMSKHSMTVFSTFIDQNKRQFKTLFGERSVHELQKSIEQALLVKNDKALASMSKSQAKLLNQYNQLAESLVTELANAIALLQTRVKINAKAIYISGGGARSTWLLEKLARVCSLPVYVTTAPETGLLGVAMIESVSCGDYANYVEAARAMAWPYTKIQADGTNNIA